MYKCKYPNCNEEFSSRRKLIYHIKKVHKIDIEVYYNVYENLIRSKCIICGKPQSWHERKLVYNLTCGDRVCNAKHAKQNSDKAILKKYGVDNIFKLKETHEKSKQTKLERYGDEKYNNIEQNKKTCLEKYGVDNASKTDFIKKVISEKYFKRNLK